MQGVELMDRELLDARALVGHLVPESSMFEFLAEHRQDVFPDGEFEDLFPSGRGRPSMPGSVMASILVLQTSHDYSDRETGEAARCDLRWKVATGMALDDAGFDASTLVYWRRRLAKSDRPHRIDDAVKHVIEGTGLLRGRRKRAVDSTILADAVATRDTVTQLISAIRRVRRVVPDAAQQIAAVCTGHDYSRPGKPRIDWEDPEVKNALVAALAGVDLDEDSQAQSALALLALVAGQDVEPAQGSDGTDGRWRIAHRVAPGRVVSTVDPDARHPRKSPENRRDGYRAQVAADPQTGIITEQELTKAAGAENSDAAVAEQFLDAEDEPCQWYGDSAYGTGDLRGAISDSDGDGAVIKPKPLQAPVEEGFTVDDFTVDEDEGTVTCPAGNTRPISPKTRTAAFGKLCGDCPLREQCTKSETGRKIVLHDRDDLLRRARRDWAEQAELREKYRKYRPNVERVISQVASRGSRRLKLRYRGTTKNHAWLTRRTAGLNLRNLVGRGLQYKAGLWVLTAETA